MVSRHLRPRINKLASAYQSAILVQWRRLGGWPDGWPNGAVAERHQAEPLVNTSLC